VPQETPRDRPRGQPPQPKARPRPSDPVWDRAEEEEYVPEPKKEPEEPKVSKDTYAMVAGLLYVIMGIYLFFMFIWRDGGREMIMLEFAITLIIISSVAVFLSLSHDLTFMPSKVSVYWTNFVAGVLTMIVAAIFIKIFKDFSSGKYDFFDDLNIIISVALGTGATYLLFHSMFYERKEPFVQDRVPISFLSGFAWAGLGGFFFYFFMEEPFTRYADAQTIFWIAMLMVIIACMAVFFNLLDNTYFAPSWATKRHMFLLSGVLLGVIIAIVLVTVLMFSADPYEIWDTLRVCVAGGIGAFAMASAVFSMGM
jgi:hypothetical protein